MAANPRKAYRACERCGVKGRAGENLSMRGLCRDCAAQAMSSAATEIANKSGPAYDRWLDGLKRAGTPSA